MRDKDEMVRLMLAHRAAADALEAALKLRQTEAFAVDRSADTSRLPYATITANVSHDRAEVVDDQVFLKWLQGKAPSEIELRMIRTVRNPKWLRETFLPTLVPMDPAELAPGEFTQCMYGEGELVPGVVWRRGGDLRSVSIKPDRDAVRRLAAAAELYAVGEAGPPELTS